MDLESITPERAVQLYLEQRQNELAKATLRSHRSRLSHFLEWCEKEGITNLNDLTGRYLYEYRVWRQQDGGLSKVSLKTQLVTLRVFVKWLEAIEAVEPDLHTKILLPSVSADEAVKDQMLSAEQAETILSYLWKYEYASTTHVIVELAWRTAMRRGSMHAVDVLDYHSNEQYLQIVHRTATPLKNQKSGERYVSLDDQTCAVIDDWLADRRPDTVDQYGREPLLASNRGRIHPSTIQQTIYSVTRPCIFTNSCPHDRDIPVCEASERPSASKCPSSLPPHAVRRGAITNWLSEDVPTRVVSDRANVTPAVIEKHYDQRDEHQKMEQRRQYSEKF